MHVSEDVCREKRVEGGGGDVQEKQEPHTKDVGNYPVSPDLKILETYCSTDSDGLALFKILATAWF